MSQEQLEFDIFSKARKELSVKGNPENSHTENFTDNPLEDKNLHSEMQSMSNEGISMPIEPSESITNIIEEPTLENTDTHALNGAEDVSVFEPLKEGDTVLLVMPSEEQDFEMHNLIKYYYPHLLKPKIKGRILRKLPYKKTQYEVEFNCSGDNVLSIYEEYLKWLA